MEQQQKVTIKQIIVNKDQDLSLKIKSISEYYKEDSFNTVDQLENVLLEEGSLEYYRQCSSILLSLLMKQCSGDKFRIEQTYNKIYSHYLNNDNTHHLVDLLSALLIQFSNHIYLDGNKLFPQLISQNHSKCKRILTLLSVALKPKKNQIDSNELSLQQLNTKQTCVVDILDAHVLIDGLINISEQNKPIPKTNKKRSLKEEAQDIKHQDTLRQLAINCLIQLRNNAQTLQKNNTVATKQTTKIITILLKSIPEIDMICRNDQDLMNEYFFFLFKQQTDFYEGKEINVMKQLNHMLCLYSKYIIIEDNSFKYFGSRNKSSLLLDIEQIQELSSDKFINRNTYQPSPSRLILVKFTAYEITKSILYSKASTHQSSHISGDSNFFNLIVSLSMMTFPVYLKEADGYDFQLNQSLENMYSYLIEEGQKTTFIDYLLIKFDSIEKNILRDARKQEKESMEDNTHSKKDQDSDFTRELEDDRFTLIGCYIILENLTGKVTEDIKGYAIRFMKYITLHIEDSVVFNYSMAFLTEMTCNFQNNMAAYHLSFMPQLINQFKITNDHERMKIADCFIRLFDELSIQKIKDMQPYLKDILLTCVREYTSKDFFSKDRALYNETFQQLFNLIISLQDIEFYLSNEILEAKQAVLAMILDKDQRDFLIKNNHQVLLLEFLKIERKYNNVTEQLLSQIQIIAKELALKVYNQETHMLNQDRIKIYNFFKKLTIEAVGSQSFFEEIFLLVLPTAINDTKQDVSLILKLQENSNLIINEFNQIVNNAEEEEGSEEEDSEDEGSEEEGLEEEGSEGGSEEEEGIEDHQNEQDEEMQDQVMDVQFKQPSDITVDTATYALDVLAVFAEQCPDLFFQYKKFEIVQVINKYQINSFLGEKIAIENQCLIGRILVCAQKYLQEQEGKMNESMENKNMFSENSLVELSPLIDIFLFRFKEENQSILIAQYMDSLLSQLQITTEKLNDKIKYSFFDKLLSVYERYLFLGMKNLNSNQIEFTITCIFEILKAVPSRINNILKITWKMMEEFLTNNESFKEIDTYEQYIQSLAKTNTDTITKTKDGLKIQSDPFITIQCISKIQDLLITQPTVYEILSPIYNHIVINEDFSEYEQYLQFMCEYVKKVIRYCPEYIDIEIMMKFYKIFEKLVQKIDEQFYKELSPVENLRLAFGMIGTTVYKQIATKKINHLPCFNLMLELIPFREEPQEYPYILYVVEFILNNSYELDAIQINHIIFYMLKAIDDPKIHETTQIDVDHTFEIFTQLRAKYPIAVQTIITLIQNEEWRLNKDNLIQSFSLN